MLIIPDTNFLIYITKFRLWHELERLFPKYNLLILPQVVYELKALSIKVRGKNKEVSLLALELINKLKRIKAKEGNVDKTIFELACWFKEVGEKNFVIATMDKILRKKLKEEGIKLLIIRKKKYLVVE